MDRETIARNLRRRQAQEALEFEQERERVLEEQLELLIGEKESARIDEAAFARMDPADADIVREHFRPADWDSGEDDFFGFERDDLLDDDELAEPVDPHEEELARLNEELADCRRRQQAFRRYLEALGS
ncbi:MAG TPA: hypothetical protein VFA44_05395 [Gaiellaceae bacterium]|nr:hypothetical protein [Gaiellaceae bacterium]